jgi:WD40 repeat protein
MNLLGTRYTAGPPIDDANVTLFDVALDSDGSLLAASTSAGGVQFWDRVSGRKLGPPLSGHDQPVTELLLSSDGLTMYTREYRGVWLRWLLDPAPCGDARASLRTAT